MIGEKRRGKLVKIGTVIAGIVFVGIGGAAAYFVPPIMQKASKEKASLPVLSAATARQAKAGDRLLLHGTLAAANKVFEKDLVIGARHVWGVSSNPNERDDYRRESRSGQSKDDREEQWWPDQEFKPSVEVSVKELGGVRLSPHSGIVAGKAASVEEDVGDEKYKWEGARRGAEVSAYVKVASVDPLEFETEMGDPVFVGTPDQLRAKEAKADRFARYAIYGLGGVFALIGLITLVFGVVKK